MFVKKFQFWFSFYSTFIYVFWLWYITSPFQITKHSLIKNSSLSKNELLLSMKFITNNVRFVLSKMSIVRFVLNVMATCWLRLILPHVYGKLPRCNQILLFQMSASVMSSPVPMTVTAAASATWSSLLTPSILREPPARHGRPRQHPPPRPALRPRVARAARPRTDHIRRQDQVFREWQIFFRFHRNIFLFAMTFKNISGILYPASLCCGKVWLHHLPSSHVTRHFAFG